VSHLYWHVRHVDALPGRLVAEDALSTRSVSRQLCRNARIPCDSARIMCHACATVRENSVGVPRILLACILLRLAWEVGNG